MTMEQVAEDIDRLTARVRALEAKIHSASGGDLPQDQAVQERQDAPAAGDGLLDEALSELRDRRRYCLRMELICHRAGEPDVAKNWSIKASECLKSIHVVRKVANIKRVAE